MGIVPFRRVSPSGSCRGSGRFPRLVSSLDCQRYPSQQKVELPEKMRRRSKGRREKRHKHSHTTNPTCFMICVFNSSVSTDKKKNIQRNMQFPWQYYKITFYWLWESNIKKKHSFYFTALCQWSTVLKVWYLFTTAALTSQTETMESGSMLVESLCCVTTRICFYFCIELSFCLWTELKL